MEVKEPIIKGFNPPPPYVDDPVILILLFNIALLVFIFVKEELADSVQSW